jgi:hypothetical protein
VLFYMRFEAFDRDSDTAIAQSGLAASGPRSGEP